MRRVRSLRVDRDVSISNLRFEMGEWRALTEANWIAADPRFGVGT